MTDHDAIDQLAALLDGEDVADAPTSLGALADLATSVRAHADLMAPTTEFRTALRADLVAAAEAPPDLSTVPAEPGLHERPDFVPRPASPSQR